MIGMGQHKFFYIVERFRKVSVAHFNRIVDNIKTCEFENRRSPLGSHGKRIDTAETVHGAEIYFTIGGHERCAGHKLIVAQPVAICEQISFSFGRHTHQPRKGGNPEV